MTNRAIISEITNDIKAYNIDDRVSQRYILNKLRDIAALYIKRENDVFRLYNQQDIWYTINCLEMEPADITKCCDIRIDNCKFLMRSVDELPEIFTYKGGAIIREVMSMDGSKNFLFTTPTAYRDITNREFIDKRLKYFWIENNHIIIPDSQVKSIKITAFWRDISKAKQLGCTNKDENTCISPLDEEFQCPVHLLSTVKEQCLNQLLNGFKRVVPDEWGNSDNNMKTSNK